jgi:hypothetical protein
VFDAAAAGSIIFTAATRPDVTATADVQGAWVGGCCVFVRCGLQPGDDARAMEQWEHGGGFSVDE